MLKYNEKIILFELFKLTEFFINLLVNNKVSLNYI